LKIPSGINPLADSDSNPISATGENKLSGLASSSLGEECAKKIQIFQVSAVNKTRPFEDPDGYYIEKPAEGFHSEGLEELMDWIATALKCADDKRIDREAYEKKHRVKVFIRHFLSSFNKVTARISFTNHPILKYISGL
jgi:hypothetical protein